MLALKFVTASLPEEADRTRVAQAVGLTNSLAVAAFPGFNGLRC